MDDLALDTAAFRWREALDAATDSLDNVSRSREALRFSTAELRARMAQLEHERETTERALERLAGTTHTHLHRHLRTTENPQREPGSPAGSSRLVTDGAERDRADTPPTRVE